MACVTSNLNIRAEEVTRAHIHINTQIMTILFRHALGEVKPGGWAVAEEPRG